MKPHIAQTIRDLLTSIDKLREMIDFLRELGNDGVPEVTPPPPLPIIPTAQPPPVAQAPAPPDWKGAKRSARNNHRAAAKVHRKSPAEMLQGALVLGPNIFTTEDFCCSAGITRLSAQACLLRWKHKGLVKHPAENQWQLEKSFYKKAAAHGLAAPPATPAPTAPPPPPMAPPEPAPPSEPSVVSRNKAELEADLAVACRQRDRARESGNDKIEAVHQKRIDQLEHELERRDN